ncbi:MAG: VanZ family protein [Verrucomicrobiales bacterium]
MSRLPGAASALPWWVGFALWVVVLQILSSQSPPEIEGPNIPHLDKIAHLGYFALGGFCLAMALTRSSGLAPLTRLAVVVLALALIGALDEWHQSFTEGRQGSDPYDWLADLSGGFLGALASGRLLKRQATPPTGKIND